MEYNNLRIFLHSFSAVSEITESIRNRDSEDVISSISNKALEKMHNYFSYKSNLDILELMDEIDSNLCKYPHRKEAYIKDLIRGFKPFIQDLDWYSKYAGFNHNNYSEDEFRLLFAKYSKELNVIILSGENYLLACYFLIYGFFVFLDAKCLSHNIDLFSIQEELNIYLFKYRAVNYLDYLGYESELKYLMKQNNKLFKHNILELKIEDKDLNTNPTFKPEKIDEIFNLIKTYFSEEDQPQLIELFKTGSTPKNKLLFKGNGKTLLDFFKQLMIGQFLTIQVQSDLEKWTSDSFYYLKNKKPCPIKRGYASKIISGTERAAEGNRLIDITKVDGKFVIEQLEIKNRIQGKNN